jgi:hypothetical protein
MIKYLALGLALQAEAALAAPACHHYSTWNYPYAQPACGRAALAARNDSNWYVEIKPETVVEQGSPTEPDQRTREQLKEFIDHNMALSLHRDELDEELQMRQDMQMRQDKLASFANQQGK